MANVTDLQTKYSKLAQEYSKLRAQNQVLKKAVVDEQANSASLKEQLKQRDQSLRKQEQEMDSLSFRNQQLAKRVELLQEELATSEAKGKKGKTKGDSPSQHGLQTQNVFDEDLQKKIEENERLHIQFYEADEQHKRKEAELKVRLSELERGSQEHQTVVEGLTTKYMENTEKLQSDKARLELKVQTLEREAKECRMRTDECQQQLRRCQTELNRQVKQSSSVIQEKVPFNDTKYSDYNSLNVPPHNRRYQLKARDIVGQALSFIQDLVAALLNFHTYTEQRVHIYPLDSSIEPISPLNQKFSQYLHENAAYVRPLEDSFLQLHQSITEDTLPTVTQKLCTTTECLVGSLGSLTIVTGKIATFFSNNLDFFTSSGYGPKGNAVPLNPLQAEMMLAHKKKAAAYMEAIRKSVPYKEALSNRRILTSSTESREGLAQQVQQSLEKIARLEQEKEHWLLEAQLGKVRLEKENQRIAELEAQLAAALETVHIVPSAAQTPVCSESVGMLCTTPSVEHVSVCALLYDSRSVHVATQLSISCVWRRLLQVGDEESMEQLIKTHYMTRVGELTTHLQISDSKAVHFHSECRALAKRLALAEKSRETLSEDVKSSNQNVTRLQDELTTTKRSYEDQLSMMSDHLCSMNETLSKQREEIDTLKLGSKLINYSKSKSADKILSVSYARVAYIDKALCVK
uniref:Protein phosphatase 1 regulatory subunit 21 n=1 Tax=Neogobius melanostomus TaxID=47308 RepID=A0A8C6WYR7_9GOBI